MPFPTKRQAIDPVVLGAERVAAEGEGLDGGDEGSGSYDDVDVDDGFGSEVGHGSAADVLDGEDGDGGGGEYGG